MVEYKLDVSQYCTENSIFVFSKEQCSLLDSYSVVIKFYVMGSSFYIKPSELFKCATGHYDFYWIFKNEDDAMMVRLSL